MVKKNKLNCDPAVKACMPNRRKYNKVRVSYNFKGATINYLLNIKDRSLDPNKEYQLCHDSGQKINNIKPTQQTWQNT